MRIYGAEIERDVRLSALVDEWARSGLLSAEQRARLAADVRVDLRRTNRFLRVTLGFFGLLIICAAAALVMVTLSPERHGIIGLLGLIAAAACIALAEFLIRRFRLYRFGVEEACVIAATMFAGIGISLIVEKPPGIAFDVEAFSGFAAASAAAFAAYLRYGFIYGALAAMLGLAVAPLTLPLQDTSQRLVAAFALGLCFIAARAKRRQHGDEWPGDEYGVIQAAAWAGVYAMLNLHLDAVGWFSDRYSPWFIWSTFAVIWVMPAAGLVWAIREKDRPLLDVSLAMSLATLVTNKPYLGLIRKPWDPILLGLASIAAVVVVKRWLAAGGDGTRNGFTSMRLLHKEKALLARAATATTMFQPGITPRAVETPPPTGFGGGRSGGGGAGESF